ncbi:hypothetical protein MMC07_006508 [Pseudocyphellaria aurata]|nr:hypothetical protein [Pseudocyphellaria aurata]
MVKIGSRVKPENMFRLCPDEVYAGTSISDWLAIVHHLEFLKPVQLEDLGIEAEECDICREPFDSADNDDEEPSEQPVILPCGHIFGKNCLSNWINIKSGHEFPEFEESLTDENPLIFHDLLPKSVEPTIDRLAEFSCPKCRRSFKIPTSGEPAPFIEARLRFWDSAYQKLSIVRSATEEVSRNDLWKFVNIFKGKQTEVRRSRKRSSFELRAQVSAMRFALRRAHWGLTPLQRTLRDGMFDLGCCGLHDAPHEYSADFYKDLPLQLWCWQFGEIEKGLNPVNGLIDGGNDYCRQFYDDLQQRRLGPWRQELFEELEDDRIVYQSDEWWDRYEVGEYLLDSSL